MRWMLAWRGERGEMSLVGVLTAAAITMVLAAGTLVMIVGAGRSSRGLMSQAPQNWTVTKRR